MSEFPRKDFRLHVGWRTIQTAVSAMLVNYFLPRPRVVSLWEGFKGSFKKDSKVGMLFRAPLRQGAFLLPSAVIQWAYYHFP